MNLKDTSWRALAAAIAMSLAACDSGTSTDAGTVAETEGAAETAAAAPAPDSLSADYRSVSLADIDTADKLTAVCEDWEADMRGRSEALEAYEGTPTIDNYLEPLNAFTVSLTNLQFPAQSLAGVHPDEALRTAGETCNQDLAKIFTDLGLSRPIYEHVAAIDVSAADAETRHGVEKMLLQFRLSGVDQDEATRERIRALNAELVEIGQTFDRNIREDTRYLELDSVDDLEGLPEDYIAAHPPGEDGKIRISTQYPDLFPFMNYAVNDGHRKALMTLFSNRGYPQNEEVLRQLIEKRYELAQLVGYDNYAELVTADKMAGSPERVASFLAELKEYTTEAQDRDYEELLTRLRQDDPGAERLQSWQSGYISEKVKVENYQVDSKEVRQYFSYDNTRDGILTLVQDLFNVRIEPWETTTWHEDVGGYSLYDGDTEIGRFYLDMHPREGKFQHAAMFPFVLGIDGEQLPVAGLICNFPSGDELMQHGQVQTYLHEFGHLIHWLFAGHRDWVNTSGINTEWDFVEAPSQMLQEWVWDYDTVSRFAVNADGEPIPRDLLDRMVAARDFGLGMGTRRQLSLAAMSLNLYNRPPDEVDFDALNEQVSTEYTKFEPIEDTHFWAAFGHLNGYSAIYYTYQWSLAIATDMFTRFEEEGLRNVETAAAYRESVLEAGGSKPAAELVTDFLGRDISFKAYADRLSGRDEPAVSDG